MPSSSSSITVDNRWDDNVANSLGPAELLLYRSNLLGADMRITNFAGGNTSAKLSETDPLSGEQSSVLWVKGSGGDLGSMQLDGFASLYMDKLLQLKAIYRGPDFEDEMVGYLPHCTYNLNARAASIDTPLHAYIDKTHVDHMHPDSIIAIAAASDSTALTEDIFDGELGWLPWRRPGFELGLMLEELVNNNPHLKGAVLASHGLFTWGEDSKQCYETTLNAINRAATWLASQTSTVVSFGGHRHTEISAPERRKVAAALMPAIRGKISANEAKIGHFNDSPEVLEFVNSNQLEELAELGTSCPDHFLRTKIKPLVLNTFSPLENNHVAVVDGLDALLTQYRNDYAAYYDRCRHDNSPPLRDANPVVFLVPGVGMLTFAKDKATARIAGEFYVNAINVMRDASAVSTYVGLDEQEAFDIEYWLLEEAKLQRMPAAKSLAGNIALVTGGAGGIGSAIASRYLDEGCCVAICDIDQQALNEREKDLSERYGADRVRAVRMDVTDEDAVTRALNTVACEFGGLDILVSNAGIASSAPIDETTLEQWQNNVDILSTGYFLVSREAFKLLKRQDNGGAMVFVASKNALVPSGGASAYCAAKASEVHLARCLALEGAPYGIRVNVVNPDAVLKDSKIWSGDWRAQRAEDYEIEPEELEAHYRNRSLLKLSVEPRDIAEAAYFLASDMSSKSTGNVFNVDAGHAPSFTR